MLGVFPLNYGGSRECRDAPANLPLTAGFSRAMKEGAGRTNAAGPGATTTQPGLTTAHLAERHAMASAWIFQKPADVRNLGEAHAPHHVGWYEPDGRRKSNSFGVGRRR